MYCKLSVVICTKDRPNKIEECINSIISQTVLPHEIIVVDSGLEKGKVNSLINNLLKTSNLEIEYIYLHTKPGLCYQRNQGLTTTSGDIIFFFDDDVILDKDYFYNILNTYQEHPEIGGVSGAIINYKPSYFYKLLKRVFYLGFFHDERQMVYWNVEQYENNDFVHVSKLTGAIMSFRRKLIKDLRFNEYLRNSFCDDIEFCYRFSLKSKLAINPKARVVHKRTPINRHSTMKYLEGTIFGYYYIFKEHLNKSLYDYISFVCLNFGLVIEGIYEMISYKTLSPLLGIFLGYKVCFSYSRKCGLCPLRLL